MATSTSPGIACNQDNTEKSSCKVERWGKSQVDYINPMEVKLLKGVSSGIAPVRSRSGATVHETFPHFAIVTQYIQGGK